MNRILKTFVFASLLVLVVGACSPASSTATLPPTSAEQIDASGQQGGQAALKRDARSGYSANFQIQFNGSTDWNYMLSTRSSSDLREVSLQLEGLAPAQNPGDIRLVTDGTQSWMIGAGTEEECIQFPNQQGMDPSFIYPESLVSLEAIGGGLQWVDEAPADNGAVTLQHFRATGAASGPWHNATVDIWQEKDSGMLREFLMQAEGEDPFFAAGAGSLRAHYLVNGLVEQTIEPVAGCEISVQLPESFSHFVRLPGMASFDSQSSVDALQQFYQALMAQENWSESAAPAQNNGATVLSYQRDAQAVQIVIEGYTDGGSKVKLLFMPAQ